MGTYFIRAVCAVLAFFTCVTDASAQRWQMQYYYDQEKSSLTIEDLCFASAKRGVAVGILTQGRHHDPTSLVTSDGGAHWQTVPLKERPISLFFLNEGLGWMVTANGLWQTTEAGKSWTKVPKAPSGMLRVYFIDQKTGWAVGFKKSVWETNDGGLQWKPVAAALAEPGDRKYSAYTWIDFVTPQSGLITGWNIPPRFTGPRFPEWLDPEATVRQRDVPHLTYSMVTQDGGKTWRTSSASLFGETARIRLTRGGRGLGLVEHSAMFRYPSEVYLIDWHTGRSSTVYRDTNFSISDVWLTDDGAAYLAGAVSQGRLRDVIPGRVQVKMSKDYKTWTEIPVDYRAVANRVTLAGVDARNLWMATDDGMILKLVP